MASTEEWTVSVRKKAFTRWINAYCRRHSLIDPLLPVKDLFKDLHDGTILCLLMGKYIRQKLIKHSIKDGPLGRKQKIENVEQVVLQVNGDGIPRFSGRPDLIVDGDHEATLELVWWVIFIIQLSFSEASGVKCDEVEVKEEMLQWIQRRVEPHAVEVTDFTTSWSDGKAFCAVIHDYHASSFPYSEVEGKEPAQRLEYAFTFAEEKVSVERLLDKEDVAVPVPDEKCILLYLSLLRQNLVFLPNELDMLMAIRPVWKKVSTMEKVEFPRLHSKLYVWGPPAENKVILEQLKQLEKLKSEYDQFGKELDMLNKDMFKYQPSLENEFENLSIRLKQDQDVLTAAEHCRAPAEQFEHFMPAVDSWLNEARANVQSLLDFAKNEASCDEAQASLLIIQEAAVERKQDIDKLLHLAADFAERRKKVIDKLANCQDTCAAPAHSSSNEEGSSFTEQAAKMLQDWEWILNQCINVLQEWFTIVLTWKVDEDFSSRKQQQESFLHRCNSLFEMLIRFTETCTSASGLNLSALQKKKEDANDYWLSICTSLEAEIAKTEVELRELNQWVKGCLEELSSQSPLADNFEGVKLQKKWYQDFLQRVAQRKPEVMRYETLRLTVHTQPLELHEASEIMKEHQLLGNQWMKLEQQSPAWGELLNRCEAAWESCLATEKELCSLEEVQVQLEPPAAKLTTLAHCKEIEMFRTSRVVPFKSKVSVMANLVARLKSLGQHPPVEELCRCVTERYNQLVSSLDRLYAATQTQVDLKDRWKALLANAQALIDWANEMRKKLSEAIADKDNFGVEDHLATCENFKQSTAEKTAQFDQFQGVAASFEAEARRMGWDTEEVTAKNAEVQQSRDSLLDFIDKTQAELQSLAERLKAEAELRELNHWVKGCLEDLSSQRPLADTLEGVKLQKQWYQDFLQRVAQREPEVLRYETLHFKVHNQPLELHEASELMKEHQLLRDHWIMLQQLKQTWEEFLDSCETAWESCLATEKELCLLEDVHAKWEPPTVNHNTVVQLEEMETFRTSRVVPFKSKVSVMANLVTHLKSLGGHPPVEELCRCVTERYNQLVSSLDRLYATTQTQVDLTGRWKALLANAQALIVWANEMRKKLSEALADKDNFGVEDHLATCENIKQSIAEKTAQFVQFQGVAASFEAEARRMDWDTEKVTAKNAEVQQSRDSLLDFIDKTQAELQALADRLKAEAELRELNHWVKGCLEDLSSQRPLADTLEGVKLQKQWYQDFLQRVAQREPEVLRYETLHFKVHNQSLELHEASEIMKEYQLLRDHWIKLQQLKQTWEELLDSCKAAWESCLATEKELRFLEDVHAKWEPPTVNHNTVVQLEEMETFRTSRVVPFKSNVSVMANLVTHLKSLGGHPPVEELCRCVTERYNQLVSSLDKLCATAQTQVDLTSRWKALLANAQALIDWANEMRKKLSVAIADKDNFGVEDHLATCENFKQSIAEKTVQFDQFQGVAASYEAEARRMGWDTEEVTAKNAEVQQSRDSLSDFIDKTQAELQSLAERLKDLVCLVTDKQAWLNEFTGRIMKWQPCLGDVGIVRFELNMAEEMLAEVCTLDAAAKQVANSMEFVVECSRPDDRKPAKGAIMDLCQRHADLKRQLQDKVSHCQTALPLWQSFTANATELTRWLEEKEKLLEKLLSSRSMLPSVRVVGEEDGLAQQIKSVQRELDDRSDKLELLTSLEADLTKVCDIAEDKAYILKKCSELRTKYDQLVKMNRFTLRPYTFPTIYRCRRYFNRRLCLLLLGLGLGVGLALTPKLLYSRLGMPTPMPSILLAMDATYIWVLRQDAEIGL